MPSESAISIENFRLPKSIERFGGEKSSCLETWLVATKFRLSITNLPASEWHFLALELLDGPAKVWYIDLLNKRMTRGLVGKEVSPFSSWDEFESALRLNHGRLNPEGRSTLQLCRKKCAEGSTPEEVSDHVDAFMKLAQEASALDDKKEELTVAILINSLPNLYMENIEKEFIFYKVKAIHEVVNRIKHRIESEKLKSEKDNETPATPMEASLSFTKYSDLECHYCGKRGHRESECWSKQRGSRAPGKGRASHSGRRGNGNWKSKHRGRNDKPPRQEGNDSNRSSRLN